jgi:hypothetical protein
MKKSAHHNQTKRFVLSPIFRHRTLLVGVGLIGGIILTMSVSYIRAQSGTVYGCVREHIGLLRIVSQGQRCLPQERAISWNIQGPQGPQGPTGPQGATTTQIVASGGAGVGSFISTQLNGYVSRGENLSYRNFDGVNFSDSTLTDINFIKSSLADTNFTNAKISNSKFAQTNVKGANFTNASFTADSTNTNTFVYEGATFENANFTNAVLKGINLTKSTVTQAKWVNTTCPDGTNSDSHDTTCEGHLAP